MNYRTMKYEKIIWFITLIYFTLSYIVSYISEYGGLLLFLVVFVLAVVYSAKNKMRIRIKITLFHWYIFIFSLFCLVSSLWAVNGNYAINRGVDIFELFIAMSVIFICFQDDLSIESLLKVVMIGGYAVVLYSILFYGFDYLRVLMIRGERVSNEAINANTLGMCAARSILINVYFIIYRQTKWWTILLLPAVFVLIVSESRKALIMVIFGVIAISIIKNIDNRKMVTSILRIILISILLVVVIYFILQLAIFDSINERLQGLINGFLGTGAVDASTRGRLRMVEIGYEVFKTSPILGVGIDNARIFTKSYVGVERYLHNNYIELLADGGVIGLCLYYYFYIYLLYHYYKYRDFKDKEYNICLVLLILTIIMDYGMVSYYNKYTYFCLMVLYIESRILRTKHNKTIEYSDSDVRIKQHER